MKRFLILLLLLLSLPAHAWGATYYVSSAGSNTSPYDTWAKAATTIQAAIEVATTAGSVIEIEQGTYNENIASRAVSVTIKASTEAGRGGVVTIAPASATHVVVLQHNNLTVNGITVQGSTGSNYNVRIAGSATGIVMNDCIIQSGTRALTTVSASATLNRCSVINHTDATVGIIVNGAPGLTLNYCKVINNAGYFRYTAGGGGACNNCLIMGTPSSVALFNDSTGTVVLNNTVVIANAYGSATLHVIRNTSSGSITANNCLLLPNPLAPDTYGFNGLTDGGGNIYASPKFRTTRYPAIAVLGTDDYTNIGEWLQIAALSETRGVRATLALDTRSVSSANWSTLASYVARGHAVVSHTRDHGNLTKLNGLTIRYTGNGISATLAINVSTHSITTAITGQSDGSSNLSVDISNASFDELDEIAAYINAQTGYTCTVTDAENNNVNPVCFADVATQDIKTANYAALLDQTRYFTHQIDGSKSDIESGIPGYSCETMVYPYNEYSADIISAVQTAGYLGARGGWSNTDCAHKHTSLFDLRHCP